MHKKSFIIDKNNSENLDVEMVIPSKLEIFMERGMLPCMPSLDRKSLTEIMEQNLMLDLTCERRDSWLDQDGKPAQDARFYAYKITYNPTGTRGNNRVSKILRVPEEFEPISLGSSYPLNKFTSNLDVIKGVCSVCYLSNKLLEADVKLNYRHAGDIKERVETGECSEKILGVYRKIYGHLF